MCKHQKSNIFWNSAFAGLNSFVAFAELKHIVSFQTQLFSNAGLCGTALATSRAQEESGNHARSVPAQCGDASVPASFFTRLVPNAQSGRNGRYTNMSGFQKEKKSISLRNCLWRMMA